MSMVNIILAKDQHVRIQSILTLAFSSKTCCSQRPMPPGRFQKTFSQKLALWKQQWIYFFEHHNLCEMTCFTSGFHPFGPTTFAAWLNYFISTQVSRGLNQKLASFLYTSMLKTASQSSWLVFLSKLFTHSAVFFFLDSYSLHAFLYNVTFIDQTDFSVYILKPGSLT